MDRTQKHTRYQRSNSEQLEVNAKLFTVIRKRNISIKEKKEKVKKLITKHPQPDINAQDGNDNCNTALHLAVERNELEVVNYLLSQGADPSITNADGKTALELAVECNNVGIIDELKSCTTYVELPSSERDRLASLNPQPVETNPNEDSVSHSNSHAAATGEQRASTALPPFSGTLRVDKELKLSHDNFKRSIEMFYGHKQISAIDQLKATPSYPTPHMLAQFAKLAYKDHKHEDPKPPEGWQLLTTASHFGIKNGYFGRAYWHPEHQQVVIAHRGTTNTYFGALLTDRNGVLKNKYVNQMSSASTFANKVVSLLQEIEKEKKVSFELFFTGHSLGGWLAQITTFTTEYLEVKGGTFRKKLKRGDETLASSAVQDSYEVKQSYHPHTVVFDSPGGKDILSKMAEQLDISLHGSSIDLQHLDITSYLSAPNLINTCNTHVGAVYRIFTDLSDMGWKEKHTPLYNIATHSMERIVKAFDTETGQVRKDDQGRLKILEVVDWPVSAGLSGGPELKEFFEWAEHLNSYHPEVMDISYIKVPKCYQQPRYQTKAYDERATSLSTFTKDERVFLESYRWLREVPKFFKPENLFSVMNNAEAQKEAEQKLLNFEIDNERIICPDASTLHNLIPYLKRLARLFAQIKDKVKDQLSLFHNTLYRYESQRYVAKIRQRAIHLKTGIDGIRKFIDSDKQIWHLRMIDGDAWTGIAKIYRALQNMTYTSNSFSEGHYIILKLKRFLPISQMTNLNALLASKEKQHLLMIECGTNQTVNDELREMFKELFSIVKQKKSIKIILTTKSNESTAEFIQQIATETLGEGFVTTDEELTWSDLTDSSKREILEKTVLFQGRRVALNQLTSAESLTDTFPLSDILKGKELKIGEEPVLHNCRGYNEKYCIDRTFNHHIVIKQDILNDTEDGKFADLLATTEQKFKQLCQQNPNRNVHWVVNDASGELLWKQTKGNLNILRKYIDVQKILSYAPSDLDNLLQHAEQQRVMLIADKAGMGKTIVLTQLAKRIKELFPAYWLVRIYLNDYTELLKAQKGKEMDKEKVLEFISKEVLKLESNLEKELFKKCFEGNEINKLVVMVDGFDEICPNYKQTVIDMLQVLKQTPSLEQVWVTTRLHLREELEDSLQQLSYTLQPFSEEEQVHFLEKFWLQTLNLASTNQQQLQTYAKTLIRKFAQSISDNDKEFTSIPLQTRLLAEAFGQKFRSFYIADKSEPELPHKMDLLGLYETFIEEKIDIFFLEQLGMKAGRMSAELRQRDLKYIKLDHQLLALEASFNKDQVTFMFTNYVEYFSYVGLARIGIVQGKIEGKPLFIHKTFAEYFVADFLINQLTKETEQHHQFRDLLLNEILSKSDYLVIRAFLDGLLEKSHPSKEVLKYYGGKMMRFGMRRKYADP